MAVLGNLGTMFVRDKNGQMVPVPVIRGEDGGFYTPEIKDGVIRWAASRPDMPEVPDMNIGTGGGGGTPDAVQFVPQELTDKQQAQARENIGAARIYTLKDGETIDDAPEDADIVWDPENEGEGAGEGTGGGAVDLTEVNERIDALEEEIADLQTSGLTTAQVNALDGMFKIASFTKDPTAAYSAFKVAFGIEESGEVEPDEPDTPVEPDEPEVTLTSISATYSGGDVAAGTAVTALTGVVVTAHYSDGSTETVTGYTLSGTIAEGSNTITVSYEGLTTTFTVTGIEAVVDENAVNIYDGFMSMNSTATSAPETDSRYPNAVCSDAMTIPYVETDNGNYKWEVKLKSNITDTSKINWKVYNSSGTRIQSLTGETTSRIGNTDSVRLNVLDQTATSDGSNAEITGFTITVYNTSGAVAKTFELGINDLRG